MILIKLIASLAVALMHRFVVSSRLVAPVQHALLFAAEAVENLVALQDRLSHASFDVSAQLFAAVSPLDLKEILLEF